MLCFKMLEKIILNLFLEASKFLHATCHHQNLEKILSRHKPMMGEVSLKTWPH